MAEFLWRKILLFILGIHVHTKMNYSYSIWACQTDILATALVSGADCIGPVSCEVVQWENGNDPPVHILFLK